MASQHTLLMGFRLEGINCKLHPPCTQPVSAATPRNRDATRANRALRPGPAAGGGAAASGGEPPLTLSVANSIWARSPLEFQAAYLDELRKRLRSSAHALTGAGPVNDWVR